MSKDSKKPMQSQSVEVTSTEPTCTIEAYLKIKKIPVWEQGGRKAFAESKGLAVATFEQFEQIFKTY